MRIIHLVYEFLLIREYFLIIKKDAFCWSKYFHSRVASYQKGDKYCLLGVTSLEGDYPSQIEQKYFSNWAVLYWKYLFKVQTCQDLCAFLVLSLTIMILDK